MKKIGIIVVSLLALVSLTACSQTDVIAKYGVSSFSEVIGVSNVSKDEILKGWSVNAPDGSARFIFSSDFKSSAPHDVMMETDAQPFIDAGLDVTKLPAGMYVEGKIMVGQSLGEQEFSSTVQKTAQDSFKQIVKLSRNTLGYHEALEHYGIDLGEGNKFEWAKDLSSNDKDIVFVLDPKIFISAGADVTNINGWVFAKVEVMDTNGKKVEVEKLLKPFNLK